MDVLPAQALSVSSERVFSSIKMTCTPEHNCIASENLKYLQVLKHALLQHRKEPVGDLPLHPLDLVSHIFKNLSVENDE